MTPRVTDDDLTPNTVPPRLRDKPAWFVWKLTDDGRKIPRAPWAHDGRPEQWVSWKQDGVRTRLGDAALWADRVPGFELATATPPPDELDGAHAARLVFFDGDNVRNPDTGHVHPEAWALLRYGVLPGDDEPTTDAAPATFMAVSTSGTGIHGFVLACIPDDCNPSTDVIELGEWDHGPDATDHETPNPEIEVFGANRFIAWTGTHVRGSNDDVPRNDALVAAVYDRYGTDDTERGQSHSPVADAAMTATRGDVEVTTNYDDVTRAIRNVNHQSLRWKSPVTEKRTDGVSRDPSWEHSKSGTRLWHYAHGFVYRKGDERYVDPLRVAALEERIITSPDDDLRGEDFWNAVDALRDRGAHIPEYVTAAEYMKRIQEQYGPEPSTTDAEQ